MGGHFRPRIFIDANVIYSKTVRDWLGLLYTDTSSDFPPFDVSWSEDVLAEALASLRDDHPEWDGGMVANVREKIAGFFEGGCVRDYDVVGSNFRGSDPGDAHVHAAAIASLSDYLVTSNVSDLLPEKGADLLPYEVLTPDEFFTLVDDAVPQVVDACIDRQIGYLNGRGQEIQLKEALEAADCPTFAQRVVAHLRERALSGL